MILVVDDDKNIRLSLKLVLERNGYEVALAENPKEAIQVIRTIPAVELVLMDMNYSLSTDGEEGLTLLKQIKGSPRDEGRGFRLHHKALGQRGAAGQDRDGSEVKLYAKSSSKREQCQDFYSKKYQIREG